MSERASPVPEPGPGVISPGVCRAIYGMPMFATLAVADLDRTVAWFVDGLDFINLFTVPDASGQPVLVHLRRWQFQDLLVRPAAAPVSVGTSCVLSIAAVYDEIDTLAERARGHGGGQVGQPVDTAWNTRELTTTDPDGNVVVFTAARPSQQADHQFSDKIKQWNDEQDTSR